MGFTKGAGSELGCVVFDTSICLFLGGACGLEWKSFGSLCVSRADAMFRAFVTEGNFADSVRSTTWAGACLLSTEDLSARGTFCRFGGRLGDSEALGGGGGCLSS